MVLERAEWVPEDPRAVGVIPGVAGADGGGRIRRDMVIRCGASGGSEWQVVMGVGARGLVDGNAAMWSAENPAR